jgi:hypothetical protein
MKRKVKFKSKGLISSTNFPVRNHKFCCCQNWRDRYSCRANPGTSQPRYLEVLHDRTAYDSYRYSSGLLSLLVCFILADEF